MKYKLLLSGKKQTIMDDFFRLMNGDFECQSTSLRREDIDSHITYFEPAAFVYCAEEEDKEDIGKAVSELIRLRQRDIPFILIGNSGDCYDFMCQAGDILSLTLIEPIAIDEVRIRITDFLREEEKEKSKRKEARQLMNLTDPEYLDGLLEEELADFHAASASIGKKEDDFKEHVKVENEPHRKYQIKKERSRPESMATESGGSHILVIDDDPRMLRLIKEELREKYNVATAVSGKIALNFLEKRKTDLILLDYAMPELDGPAVLEKLRENNATRDIPVVFLTGINDRSKIQKVLDMKPQGYLLKPIETEKLFRTIRRIIG